MFWIGFGLGFLTCAGLITAVIAVVNWAGKETPFPDKEGNPRDWKDAATSRERKS